MGRPGLEPKSSTGWVGSANWIRQLEVQAFIRVLADCRCTEAAKFEVRTRVRRSAVHRHLYS